MKNYLTGCDLPGSGLSGLHPLRQHLTREERHCSCCWFEVHGLGGPAPFVLDADEEQRCADPLLLHLPGYRPVLLSCREWDRLGADQDELDQFLVVLEESEPWEGNAQAVADELGVRFQDAWEFCVKNGRKAPPSMQEVA